MTVSRRAFITSAGCSVISLGIRAAEPAGFFRVGRRQGRWLLTDPQGQPFFSIGLNHIDPSPLQYPETSRIWRDKYGNSMQRWLAQTVRSDLRTWGFNSVGWVQEFVTSDVRHSRRFTFEEYQWLNLPYCHLLPFVEFHQWEKQTRHPDFFSKEFAEWCDYVARSECSRFAADPKLIGYFYVDCPTWVHDRPGNQWRGPLFDPKKLDTERGRQELLRMAEQYYRVTHAAIRRYDKNHLILGDRYEAKAPLPAEVLQAAKPFVDVLSFQHFGPPQEVKRDLERFHRATGMPVLYADGCVAKAQADGSKRHSPRGYQDLMEALLSVESCVGLHLCGAYLKNRARRRGLRNEDETPDEEAIQAVSESNRKTSRWMERYK